MSGIHFYSDHNKLASINHNTPKYYLGPQVISTTIGDLRWPSRNYTQV